MTTLGRGGSKFPRGTRSYTMSRIRGKDTSIERMVRSYLFAQGLRFRKNDKRYPGHPDVVLPKWRAMVFVNGCFWHLYEGCENYSLPKSRVEYWAAKLLRNRERDQEQRAALAKQGWRIFTIWECELKPDRRQASLEALYKAITGTGPEEEEDGGPKKPTQTDKGSV
ncbi:DNA mismatch endonuclease, patch repair protein [Bifidobacterium actinocoloniiforme DSM 22766]|uniref:Very short patch repair endonuclease n=1 Tax=Bifidobacterium actinocoloniiforme DSM 22766 TaxID=1437605 RepID=A0A086Z0Q3_9BIFI|nr:very short patch repair endonuclease [Bifidobacterium actinocoloniiforme]AKV55310.1 DNA mismatch repair protein Vsr [Bifidobacterium actinocoloniiforme DSM 22766]KFI40103.1 DNA mismatch endonuclease, patch repair protein [Bifidobacterium actinocoloniiforme DSM 22766]